MCYVCDNCEKVDKNTPLLACNEDFFNHHDTTERPIETTTHSFETSDRITETRSSESSTVTTSEEPSTTAVETTTEPGTTETTGSTDLPMPTPATVGPPETTTGVPTPPTENRLDMVQISTKFSDASEPENSTDLYIRQRRALIDTGISYHCYKVEKTGEHIHIDDS